MKLQFSGLCIGTYNESEYHASFNYNDPSQNPFDLQAKLNDKVLPLLKKHLTSKYYTIDKFVIDDQGAANTLLITFNTSEANIAGLIRDLTACLDSINRELKTPFTQAFYQPAKEEKTAVDEKGFQPS